LAEWGRWDDEFDDVTLTSLQAAYIRRKRWEARLQAVEVWNVLGQVMGNESEPAPCAISTCGRRYQRVSSDALLTKMGVVFGSDK